MGRKNVGHDRPNALKVLASKGQDHWIFIFKGQAHEMKRIKAIMLFNYLILLAMIFRKPQSTIYNSPLSHKVGDYGA
jgi:hypothetical protein